MPIALRPAVSTGLFALLAVLTLAIPTHASRADDEPAPWQRWVNRLHSEKPADVLVELAKVDRAVRTEAVRRSGDGIAYEDFRSAWTRLQRNADVEADRWIIESYHAALPRHPIRIAGPAHVATFLDEDRMVDLWSAATKAYEAEQRANDKIRDKIDRARRRGKREEARSYRTRRLEHEFLRTALDVFRFVPKSSKLESKLWRCVQDTSLSPRLMPLVVGALEGAVDLSLLKKLAQRYRSERAPIRTACLRVLAAAASEYQTMNSRRLVRLERLLPKLIDRYLDHSPGREETRALIHLVSRQRDMVGLDLVADEAIFDDRLTERIFAIHRLAAFAEVEDFESVIEKIERSTRGSETIRENVTIAILEALIDGKSPLAVRRIELASHDASPRVRLAAAGLAKQLPAEPSIPILAHLLDDKCAQVANVALWSLYRKQRFAALEPVVRKLDAIVKRGGLLENDAFQILRNATRQDHGKDVARWVRWWDEERPTDVLEFQRPITAAGTAVGFFDHRIYSYHVGFVLDVSGSMDSADGSGPTTRFQILCREVERALRSLDPEARFNVIAFSNGAKLLSPTALRATPFNIQRAIDFLIDQPGGGTNYDAALTTSLGAQDLDTLFFLSDGQPDARRRKPAELRTWFREQNVGQRLIVNTIGIQDSSDLLRQLAADHLGLYRAMTLFVPVR